MTRICSATPRSSSGQRRRTAALRTRTATARWTPRSRRGKCSLLLDDHCFRCRGRAAAQPVARRIRHLERILACLPQSSADLLVFITLIELAQRSPEVLRAPQRHPALAIPIGEHRIVTIAAILALQVTDRVSPRGTLVYRTLRRPLNRLAHRRRVPLAHPVPGAPSQALAGDHSNLTRRGRPHIHSLRSVGGRTEAGRTKPSREITQT